MNVAIRQARIGDLGRLATMFHSLWPEATPAEHAADIRPVFNSGRYGTLPGVILVSQDSSDALTGFVQVGLRSHADGCNPSHHVGFLEGWFVEEKLRHRGIGKALIQAAEKWARSYGCFEIASDTWITDEDSLRAHQALGFEVVDRCIHFRKPL